ncbi:MAG TPA: hypothetical protein VIV14_09645 [Gammaproteobacteria bacterium]
MASRPSPSGARKRVLYEMLDTAHAVRADNAFLVEMRAEKRFATDLPGEVFSDGRMRVPVRVGNVSRSGLMVRGELADLLSALNWRGPDRDFAVTLNVRFDVPTSQDRELSVEARCRTKYARRAAPGDYQIGMKILSFSEGRAGYVDYVWRRKSQE